MNNERKSFSRCRGCHVLALGLVGLLTLAQPTQGATLNVPTQYSTIQAAINAAANGDTIQVAAGVYAEHLTWSYKNLFLKGAGAAKTIIDGGGTGRCLYLSFVPRAAKIEGFTFRNGYVTGSDYGGGLYNDNSFPTITNCTFSNNSAGYGGGMFNRNSNSNLINCTFSGNAAGAGGGMYNNNSSSPNLTNCTFSGNTASSGGGMSNYNNSNPTLTNCTFSENTTSGFGGGMTNFNNSSPTLTNCTFRKNSVTSAFQSGGGMANFSNSNPTLANCTFSGNTAAFGGGMASFDSSPSLTNGTFSGNAAATGGGGIYNVRSSPLITNSIFSGNTATQDGGGMANIPNSNPTIINSTFSGNTAGRFGGGMYNLISNPTLTNSILWGDTGGEIYNTASTPVVTYSNVQGGYAGTGNLNQDPLFVRPPSPGDFGDLRLQLGSPCINAGNNAAVPPGVTTDLAGNPRIQNGTVEMGAYEFGPSQQITQLTNQVQTLVTGGVLNPGQGSSLNAKLNLALAAINRGQTVVACRQLNAFVNQVQDYVTNGVLTFEQGLALLTAANDIRLSLGC